MKLNFLVPKYCSLKIPKLSRPCSFKNSNLIFVVFCSEFFSGLILSILLLFPPNYTCKLTSKFPLFIPYCLYNPSSATFAKVRKVS